MVALGAALLLGSENAGTKAQGASGKRDKVTLDVFNLHQYPSILENFNFVLFLAIIMVKYRLIIGQLCVVAALILATSHHGLHLYWVDRHEAYIG